MVAQMTIEVSYPLPPDLPPSAVLAALHTSYEPLMKPHPFQKGFKRRPLSVDEVVDDPFFRADGRKLESYEVSDRIPILPGVHKDITVPAVFQSFDGGVRCRADAPGGVRIWSVYEPRKAAPAAAGGEPGGAGYELHETAVIECNAIFKRFVAKNFESSHRENLKGIVGLLADMYRKGEK
ncbi:hypothetical protein MCOR25_010888 [Pyricularia grisea]|uniref:DUF7053 domain-containing protein n=1 Tax=Pyricularia grisea TaxID=148305 RepID=A0A6P8ASH4_PYRGI|nr:uncharacterized protein PgNI_09633 [Pyricularia grisea]KAI6347833.1 hypothetical protein MCOR25_010888 [Pyricularia grisea]TLD05074.1 hypothetical protein PgNI_09633 [Pyricularia grisea]